MATVDRETRDARRVLVVNGGGLIDDSAVDALRARGYEVSMVSSDWGAIRRDKQWRPFVVVIGIAADDASSQRTFWKLVSQRSAPAVMCVVRTGGEGLATKVFYANSSGTDRTPSCEHRVAALVLQSMTAIHPDRVTEGGLEHQGQEGHASRRWVKIVIRGIQSPRDLMTLSEWGRFVGASASTIRGWCRTARMSPRNSLHFMRTLRAVIRHEAGEGPEELLDIADTRTIARLMKLCGSSRSDELPESVDAFLRSQQFLPRSCQPLEAVWVELHQQGLC
jgi:hypothetical protein